MSTWFGDADLNGEFNSSDFVQAFQVGKYEMGWLDSLGQASRCTRRLGRRRLERRWHLLLRRLH